MSSLLPRKSLVTEASTLYKLLHGVVCIYKPLGYSNARTINEFKKKMCLELNSMKPPPRAEHIQVRRINPANPERILPMEKEQILAQFPDQYGHQIEVAKGLSLADHPLVLGKRYRNKDFSMLATGPTSSETSGVHLYGINPPGLLLARRIYAGRWVRKYLISGRFGVATDTFFHTGRIVEKSTYGNVKRYLLERLLLSTQSSHQKMSFLASGVPLDSDRAYELASQGLVRPQGYTHPVLYQITLEHFNPPDFTLQVSVINEEFEYFKRLVHEIGLKMHSNAVCTKIVCTNVGPFGVDDALLFRNWSLEHVLGNIKQVQRKLQSINTFERVPWVGNRVIDNETLNEDEEI